MVKLMYLVILGEQQLKRMNEDEDVSLVAFYETTTTNTYRRRLQVISLQSGKVFIFNIYYK